MAQGYILCCCCSVIRSCPTLCDPMDYSTQISLSFTVSQSLLNSCPLSRWYHPTISFCFPLLLLPSIFPSIRVFSNELAFCVRWPEYWSFSFRISLSNEYSGLISFNINIPTNVYCSISASLRELAMGFHSDSYIWRLNRNRIRKLRDDVKIKYLENEKGKEITDRTRIQEPSYAEAPMCGELPVEQDWG